jgi:UDP-N-acetylmuramate: L-alanyl-gamma-D-glutamyl-meso-diaminopimelate ligase
MKEEDQTLSPQLVYQQNKDKQRVVITGSQAKMITAMVIFVLDTYHREFDIVAPLPLRGSSSSSRISDPPLIIIQENEQPTASILAYHHHIGVISDMPEGNDDVINRFADATPKGGILIFSEIDPVGKIGKKDRPGITGIAYKTYSNTVENGTVALLSTKNDRFPIRVSGDQNLRNLSAAKELLKKIGITSSQFYSAIPRFEA